MVFQFTFPDVGEGISEGILVKWKVKEGQTIQENDALAEVETAKAIVEVPSPRVGTILRLHCPEGAKIHVGEVLVTIGSPGETLSSEQLEKVPLEKKKEVLKEEKHSEGIQKAPVILPEELKAFPAARQRAKELGVDLRQIAGTGKEGIITLADVERSAGKGQQRATKESKEGGTQGKEQHIGFDSYGRLMHIPLTGVRKIIAETMILSKTTIPHVTHLDEADVTALDDFRKKKKEYAENKGVHLTLLPFIIKAAVSCLKKFPYLNAVFDAEKQEIIIKEYYNVGFAVDTPKGLLVPVLKNADSLGILFMGQKIEVLATHARQGDIQPTDMQGATFTITNIGSYGGTAATPIILPGTAAILGVYRMKEKAVVKEGKVVVRKMLPLSITFDHRITDGGYAARFMNELIALLEDPEILFVEGS